MKIIPLCGLELARRGAFSFFINDKTILNDNFNCLNTQENFQL